MAKATEDQYIDLIRERYSVSTEEASEELKVHRSTASRVLNRLVREGKLRRFSVAVYPAKGIRIVHSYNYTLAAEKED